MKWLLTYSICLIFFGSFCQSPVFDSLRNELNKSKADTNRVKILLALGYRFYQISPDSVSKYSHHALELSEELKYQKGVANALNNLGSMEYTLANYDDALDNYLKFLAISMLINDQNGTRRAYNNIGTIRMLQGDYEQAVISYENSLKILNEDQDDLAKSQVLNNLGSVYYELGDYETAIQLHHESIRIKKQLGNEESCSATYSNLGEVYSESGNHEKALEFYYRALKIDLAFKKSLRIASVTQEIANTFIKAKRYDSAEKYLDQSFKISKKHDYKLLLAKHNNYYGNIYSSLGQHQKALRSYTRAKDEFMRLGNKIGEIGSLILLGKLHFKTINYRKSIQAGMIAWEKASLLNLKKEMTEAAELLSSAYEKVGEYKSAYSYLKLYNSLYDSVYSFNAEISQYEVNQTVESVTGNVQVLLPGAGGEDHSTPSIYIQNIIIYGGLFLLIMAILLIVVWRNFYKVRKRSYTLIESKNRQIFDQTKQLKSQSQQLTNMNREIIKINESLEVKVEERTKKIESQNKKLKEYAFSNAHLVRAPLARILGFTVFLKEEGIADEMRNELNENILKSAEELDQIIRRVSDILGEEQPPN